MKSIRLLFLGLAVALSLFGCTSKAEEPSLTPEPAPSSMPVETFSPPSLALPTPSPIPSPELEEGNYFDNALFVGDSIMEGIRQYVAAQRQEGELLGTARFLSTTMGVSLADLVVDRDNGVQYSYQGEERPLEDIVAEIAPETSIQVHDIDALGERIPRDQPIILAEDSILLTKMIKDSLFRAGYGNLKNFNNGKEAWEYLESIRNDSDFYKKAALLITDIEMPEMDGHRLTKLVKDDEKMRRMPVIIFSSLINEEMRRKGKQLGADEQLSKPEIGRLVEIMDELLDRRDG